MSNSFRDQTAIADYAAIHFREQMDQTRRLANEVDAEILRKPRPDGKWSIAGLFDHMAIMNNLYVGKLKGAVDRAPVSSRRDWRPTVAGRMLRWAVNTRLKLPTAPVFVPANPSSDPEAVDRFVASIGELIAVLEKSQAVHWNSIRVSSPASELIKLNIGDVFLALSDHADRHLHQIDEHLQELGTSRPPFS